MKPIHKFFLFSGLTLFFSLVLWGSLAFLEIPVSNLETGESSNRIALGVYILNGFIPSILGVLLIIVTEKKSRKEMLSSILPKKEHTNTLLQILGLFVLCFVMQIILYEIFISGFEYATIWKNLFQIIPLFILGPLSEEIGWRGYMQKQVNQITTPIKGSLVIGIIWALWHLPLFYIIGTTQQSNDVSFITFTILILLLSWIMTYYYIQTKGNIFIAIFIHWVYTITLSFYVLSTSYSTLSDILSIIPYAVLSISLYLIYTKKRAVS